VSNFLKIFDNNRCHLGEGPIWHSEKKCLIWFDILEKKMFIKSFEDKKPDIHFFDEFVSSAAIIDISNLLLSSETGLYKYDIEKRTKKKIIGIEDELSSNRSNDGRVDTLGGFWISTMGKKHEKNKGAIYRFFRGEVKKLFSQISIPNSICFSPCGKFLYFSDTLERKILKTELDSLGWPKTNTEIFLDFSKSKLNPDGSVIDTDGCLWNAQWGSFNISKYDEKGKLIKVVALDVPLVTCPAIGGKKNSTLFVTTATEGMNNEEKIRFPKSGNVFCLEVDSFGLKEARVKL